MTITSTNLLVLSKAEHLYDLRDLYEVEARDVWDGHLDHPMSLRVNYGRAHELVEHYVRA